MSSKHSYADNPYVDEQGRTDAETYLMGCLDGTVVAGRRMIQLADKMLPRIRNGYKRWRYDVDAATSPVEFIERFCYIPSGKLGVPFILEPYERMIVELIFGFVDADGVREIQYAFIEVARKNGKGVSVSQELPTPSGWRKMGDLHVGDMVFGQDGKPSAIIAESEIFDKPTYVITFEDGASFKVTDDHIWTVQTNGSRRCARNYLPGETSQSDHRRFREGGWFETTTQEMFDDPCFAYRRADGRGVEYKYRVPMALPVEYPEKELPIDPYTFGFWIGDGSSGGPEITAGLADLDETISLLEGHGHTCVPRISHDTTYTVRLDGAGCGRKNPLKESLSELGVLNNKHIPDIYLQGSIEQRWELLRGLMDTDGYCSKAGQCEFTQKSELIVDQLIELCSSLGIKASKSSKEARCNGVPAGTVYQAQFWTDKTHSCFHIKRKHNRLKDKLAPRMSCKSIVSIERIPNEPTKCIAIDNPSHLYLVGRQYTATHNTSLSAAIALYMLVADGEGSPAVVTSASSKSQASLAFGALWKMVRQSPALKKYLRKGLIPERGESGIVCDANMGYAVALSKQSDHLDGLDLSFVLADELAAWKTRDVYDLCRQAQSSRAAPIMVCISTSGFIRGQIFDIELEQGYKWLSDEIEDDRSLYILFEQDNRDEIWSNDIEVLKKSNPGLGTVKSVNFLRSQILKAKNDISYLPTLLTKDFNIPANEAHAFLTYEEAVNKTEYDFDPSVFRYAICAFDAADSIDLNAATMLFMKPGDNHIYRKSHYWIPEEQVKINSNNMRQRDGIPYHDLEAKGLLTIVPGNCVDRRVFVDFIKDMADIGLYTRYVGYDPWHMDSIVPELKMLCGAENVEPVRQGAQSLSQPLKQLKADMRDGRIIDGNNVLDHINNLNCSVKEDINGNIVPIKKSGPTSRIDGFIALLVAYVTFLRHEQDYLQIIGWYPPEEG